MGLADDKKCVCVDIPSVVTSSITVPCGPFHAPSPPMKRNNFLVLHFRSNHIGLPLSAVHTKEAKSKRLQLAGDITHTRIRRLRRIPRPGASSHRQRCSIWASCKARRVDTTVVTIEVTKIIMTKRERSLFRNKNEKHLKQTNRCTNMR